MNTYEVMIPYTGEMTVRVKANNSKEAIKKAMQWEHIQGTEDDNAHGIKHLFHKAKVTLYDGSYDNEE